MPLFFCSDCLMYAVCNPNYIYCAGKYEKVVAVLLYKLTKNIIS